MSMRFASLMAAAALSAAATPAASQDRWEDVPALPPLDQGADAGTWDGEWEGTWDDQETYQGTWRGTFSGLDGQTVEAEYSGTFIGQARFLADDGPELYRDDGGGWRERHHGDRAADGYRKGYRSQGHARRGYSAEQRDAWLDQCRSNQFYSGGAERGAAIGAALGALGGGVAGNRIAGRGDRLEGTLLGAGAGAIAGAALGGVIGAESDRRGVADFCQDYLSRYEEGVSEYARSLGGYGAYGAGAIVWVRVPIIRERRECGCEEVIEEWVEEDVSPPKRARRVVRPADKRVRISK